MPRLMLIALFALLAACGQKGPLYLPDEPQVAETAAASHSESAPAASDPAQSTRAEPTQDAEESDQ